MRPIEEIIKELESHPDYITSQIFTWTEFMESVNGSFDFEKKEKIEYSEIAENLKSDVIDYIGNRIFELDSFYPNLLRNDDGELEVDQDYY
jgi:hypothetical protein